MKITIQDAIKIQEKRVRLNGLIEGEIRPEIIEADKLLLEAIREKGEWENPQQLRFTEVMQMVGEPVYLICNSLNIREWNVIQGFSEERKEVIEGKLYSVFGESSVKFINGRRFRTEEYGKKWTAYRYRPKGV